MINLLQVVLEPEKSHLRAFDGSERENRANVSVATALPRHGIHVDARVAGDGGELVVGRILE